MRTRGAHFVCGRVHPAEVRDAKDFRFRKVLYTTGGSVAREPAGPVAVLRPETQTTGRGVCLSGLPFLLGRSLDSWGEMRTRGAHFVWRPGQLTAWVVHRSGLPYLLLEGLR